MSKELTIHQVEILQDRITELTTECAETEGAIKQIKAQWKADYKCGSKKEMETLQKETEERIKMLKVKRKGLTAKIQEIVPEDILDEIFEEEDE